MREPETGISESTDSHVFFLCIAESGDVYKLNLYGLC